MGNNLSEYGSILIRTDQAYYIAGQQVTGAIHLQIIKQFPLQIITLNIEGFEECSWQQNTIEKNKTQSYNGKVTIYNHKFTIFQNQNPCMKKGGYVFLFSFHLNHYLPGSFKEATKSYKAKIQYKLTGICTTKDHQRFQCEQQLILREEKQIQHIMCAEMTLKPRTFFFFNQGRCKVRCFFQKNTYLPGQQALIICQVDNLYCNLPLERIDCHLYKYLSLTSQQGRQITIKEHVNQVRITGVQSGRTFKRDAAKRRLLKLYNKIQKRPLPASTNGRLIKCQYLLELEQKFIGCLCGDTLTTCFTKTQLVSPPAIFPHIDQPQDWDPQIFPNKSFIIESGLKYSRNIKIQAQNSDFTKEGMLTSEQSKFIGS